MALLLSASNLAAPSASKPRHHQPTLRLRRRQQLNIYLLASADWSSVPAQPLSNLLRIGVRFFKNGPLPLPSSSRLLQSSKNCHHQPSFLLLLAAVIRMSSLGLDNMIISSRTFAHESKRAACLRGKRSGLGLTVGSTRTQPARSAFISRGSDFSSSLIIRPQVGPVNLVR